MPSRPPVRRHSMLPGSLAAASSCFAFSSPKSSANGSAASTLQTGSAARPRKFCSTPSSAGPAARGQGTVARRTQPLAHRSRPLRSRSSPPATAHTRGTISSLSVVSACSGVFERTRRGTSNVAGRCVEILQHRIRHRAEAERVQRPAIFFRARVVVPPLHRVAGRRLEQELRCRRIHARPAHLEIEQPAGRQRHVADHFGIDSKSRPALQQSIVRIPGNLLRPTSSTTADKSPTSRSTGGCASDSNHDP